MSVTRIASRYAKSLLDLSIEQENVDSVLKDMNSLEAAVQNRDLYLMLKSPIINSKKKRDIIGALFNEGFDKMSLAFMNIILSKGREEYLPEISSEFIKLYRDYKKISKAVVTSAHKLSEEALAKIKSKLISSSITNYSVEIETQVNPELIGGFIIEIGDKLYDASVAHKLETLKKGFVGNSYKA